MDQDSISQCLFLFLFLILGSAWAATLMYSLRKNEDTGKLANRLIWFALAWNVFALGHRWMIAGHAPWANQYESATMVAFGAILLFVIFQRTHKVPALGLLVIPAAMIVIAAANLLPAEYKKVNPLMPALQSYWLKIHVSLMLLSYGAFATTFGLSLMYLIKDGAWTRKSTRIALPIIGLLTGIFFAYVHATARSAAWDSFMDTLHWSEINGGMPKAYFTLGLAGAVLGYLAALLCGLLPNSLIELFPDKETLDELNYQSVAVGYPMLFLGIILGAMWGHVAWGRYWGWDPKETWAFISLLIFTFFLHQRVLRGWDGRRLAWIGLIGAGSIVFTYWGVNFLVPGLHAYAKGT
jgi:cytochrome c-type biogenesis protein CcsB